MKNHCADRRGKQRVERFRVRNDDGAILQTDAQQCVGVLDQTFCVVLLRVGDELLQLQERAVALVCKLSVCRRERANHKLFERAVRVDTRHTVQP